jgi:nucleoside-diphosphate-sugar epimerase
MALGSVLVTGAAGALGGAVCQRLRADGWRTVAVVRGVETVVGAVTVRADVTDPPAVRHPSTRPPPTRPRPCGRW